MLQLTPALRNSGYGLRPQAEVDYAFLERLFVSTREAEVALLDWTDEAKLAFLRHQFSLQHTHYLRFYAEAEFSIVLCNGEAIGRLYIFRGREDYRIVDISLLPDARNRGIGSALLQCVLAEALESGKTVSIHVENFNPARRLYKRLGFRDVEESGPYWLMEYKRSQSDSINEDAPLLKRASRCC